MNNSIIHSDKQRSKRANIVYGISSFIAILFAILSLWALRKFILPSTVGALFAYVCLPLIAYLRSRGWSRIWAISILFSIFSLSSVGLLGMIYTVFPDKQGEIELQIRLRNKLNEKYGQVMGLKSNTHEGNFIYKMLGRDGDIIMADIDQMLSLNNQDRALFESNLRGELTNQEPVSKNIIAYYVANQARDIKQPSHASKTKTTKKQPDNNNNYSSFISSAIDMLTSWIVMPLVFLILLFDNGTIKKFFVRSIPNIYFEVSLTVIDKVNGAVGKYLRGTALQCLMVALSFTIMFLFVGVNFKWAMIMGIIAGLANAIPFLGPAIGLAVGLIYSFMVEQITPAIGLINLTNLPIMMLIVVLFVQIMDNAFFQPYILGKAVNLHPLVVIFAVMGGSVLFGFTGMLLAIPFVVVSKEIVHTFFTELRAYKII